MQIAISQLTKQVSASAGRPLVLSCLRLGIAIDAETGVMQDFTTFITDSPVDILCFYNYQNEDGDTEYRSHLFERVTTVDWYVLNDNDVSIALLDEMYFIIFSSTQKTVTVNYAPLFISTDIIKFEGAQRENKATFITTDNYTAEQL